jgi:hypothetical protein
MRFTDNISEILVDYSFVDTPACEKGEWYRLLGEIRHGSETRALYLTLNLPPLVVAGLDVEVYEECIDVRNEFLSTFESLIAYACKHK